MITCSFTLQCRLVHLATTKTKGRGPVLNLNTCLDPVTFSLVYWYPVFKQLDLTRTLPPTSKIPRTEQLTWRNKLVFPPLPHHPGVSSVLALLKFLTVMGEDYQMQTYGRMRFIFIEEEKTSSIQYTVQLFSVPLFESRDIRYL